MKQWIRDIGTAMLIESFFIGNANRQRLKSEKAAPEE